MDSEDACVNGGTVARVGFGIEHTGWRGCGAKARGSLFSAEPSVSDGRWQMTDCPYPS